MTIDENVLIEQFLAMVQIDSESGSEEAHLDYLASCLSEFGASVEYDSFGNLIGRVPGRDSYRQEPILLCGHADTIRPSVGVVPVVESGVISSSGNTVLGADNKAGIAEIFSALRTAQRRPAIELLITREEEVGLNGSRNVDQSLLKSSMGFVVDIQALDAVIIGAPTHYFIDIEIEGRAAHAGLRPEQGISAIAVAAKAIASLEIGRIDEETTCNIGLLTAGQARNAVPANASIRAECRSLCHDKAEAVALAVKEAFESASSSAGARCSVHLDLRHKANRVSKESATVKAAMAALEANGISPNVFSATAGTDAVWLNDKGIETVVLGFGGQGAHTTAESIEIANMVTATRTLVHLIESLA